jgi:hypothetical protein
VSVQLLLPSHTSSVPSNSPGLYGASAYQEA